MNNTINNNSRTGTTPVNNNNNNSNNGGNGRTNVTVLATDNNNNRTLSSDNVYTLRTVVTPCESIGGEDDEDFHFTVKFAIENATQGKAK